MHRSITRHPIAMAVVVALVGALLGSGVTVTGASAAPMSATVRGDAPQWGVAEEQAFVDRINALRASVGVPQLSVDPNLTTAARSWAQTMKDNGAISHAPDITTGAPANWAKVGENVGVGGTVDALFAAFVASPHHYANLVDPAFRYVGVGVVWDGSVMYTTHRFMSLYTPPAPTPAPVVKAAATIHPATVPSRRKVPTRRPAKKVTVKRATRTPARRATRRPVGRA